MRYLMKGGYWKNSEDEMLKAAVMKYGLNQWARIASLLARKSAKQCKARWYEWLDPRIKKTDWTREEEEKLLHLAKVFPAQWRTIAPLVGRTPHQCLEHYDKLLDMAQGREMGENDPRRLRAGEIDPNPEVRPARADPIDMDDDEKEMIAEARVRIANVKGKKAKRKAREKVIDEARRLAQLQKFRELRNAGVDFIIERKDRKKKKEFSYGDEIPLERKPIELVYKIDESEKVDRIDDNVANINITQLEGERRIEDEVKRRQQDIEKIKRLKKTDLPARLDRLNKERSDYIKKDPLVLSQPQLTDEDYDNLVKLHKRNQDGMGKYKPTDFLLQEKNYTDSEILPIRTPKPENSILMSAKEASYLQDPLNAGYERSLKSADISMITRSNKNIVTPNPYKAMLEDLSIKSIQKGNISVKDDDKLSLNSALKSLKNESYASVQKSLIEDNWQLLNYQNIENSKKLKKLKNQKISEIFNQLPPPKNHMSPDSDYIDQLLAKCRQDFDSQIAETFNIKDLVLRGIEEDCTDLLGETINYHMINQLNSSHKLQIKLMDELLEHEIDENPITQQLVDEIAKLIYNNKFN